MVRQWFYAVAVAALIGLGLVALVCQANDMRVKTFDEVYDFLQPGQLLDGEGLSQVWRRDWEAA